MTLFSLSFVEKFTLFYCGSKSCKFLGSSKFFVKKIKFLDRVKIKIEALWNFKNETFVRITFEFLTPIFVGLKGFKEYWENSRFKRFELARTGGKRILLIPKLSLHVESEIRRSLQIQALRAIFMCPTLMFDPKFLSWNCWKIPDFS